ncbi:MAG: methyltransferase [Porticoccaceae bacterium]
MIPSDCAAEIAARFDLVVCNPPQHRGFARDQVLTGCFFHAAAAHLDLRRAAVFVIHRSVPATNLAAASGAHVDLLAAADNFRVHLAQAPIGQELGHQLTPVMTSVRIARTGREWHRYPEVTATRPDSRSNRGDRRN